METKRLARFVIEKQAMNFSIAHFTIFSATERENLHGHNFQVRCELVAPVGKDGLAFNYGIIKKLVRALCDKINEKLILPEHSPYLILDDQDDYLVAEFNGEKLPFLKRDVLMIMGNGIHRFVHTTRCQYAITDFDIFHCYHTFALDVGCYVR